jgi:DNA polymerase V
VIILKGVSRVPVHIPLVAMKIPAGPPAPAEDEYVEDRIDLSEYLTPRPDNSFLVRVEGDSMIEAGIRPGDLLVVERAPEAQSGDIVIAVVGGQFTVKRLHKHQGTLHLVGANNTFPEPAQEEFSVWGIVKFAVHKF